MSGNSGNLRVPVKPEIISRPAVASNRIIATSPGGKNDLKYFTRSGDILLSPSERSPTVTIHPRDECNAIANAGYVIEIRNLSRLFPRPRSPGVAP